MNALRVRCLARPSDPHSRSRRYDLCDATWVYTTTLLTAGDRADEVRWT
jgi:hypothetical protein